MADGQRRAGSESALFGETRARGAGQSYVCSVRPDRRVCAGFSFHCGAYRLRKLAEFYNSPGFSDERSWVFLAQDLEQRAVSAHSPEEAAMAIERVALDEVPMLIQSGRLLDAKSIIGLCLAREALKS